MNGDSPKRTPQKSVATDAAAHWLHLLTEQWPVSKMFFFFFLMLQWCEETQDECLNEALFCMFVILILSIGKEPLIEGYHV